MQPIKCRSCEDRSLCFVFGSNEMGTHGLGAAKHAVGDHGAKWGIGFGPSQYHVIAPDREGLTKIPVSSFAIPTKDWVIGRLSLDVIAVYVARFIQYAKYHPDLRFDITPIGTGLAGYKHEDIKPMFANVPSNCLLPDVWK